MTLKKCQIRRPNEKSRRSHKLRWRADGAFSEEVERVFEMLRDRIGLNAQHLHNVGETPNRQSERGEGAVPTTSPTGQSGPFSQEVERVFEMLRDKELD